MMEQAAVVEDADSRDEHRADKDACDLRARRSVEGEEYCDHHRSVHGKAAKKGDRRQMNLARSRQVDHSDTERQGAHGNNQHE